MYSLLTNLEQAMFFLMLIISLIAANKASKLIYSGTDKELFRRAGKLRFWAGFLTALALVAVAADVILAAFAHPVFWMDRLLLKAPLALVAIAPLWLLSASRIRMLRQRTRSQSEAVLDDSKRRHATEPALVAPFQLSALVSFGILYFVLAPPVPFQWFNAIMPITIMLFAAGMIWMAQTRRNQIATADPSAAIYRPWRRRLRLTGITAIAAAIAALPVLLAMDGSKLPARMSMMAGTADYGTVPGQAKQAGSLAAWSSSHSSHNAASVAAADAGQDGVVSVDALTGPQQGKADRTFTLTAKQAQIQTSSGKVIEAWTYNGEAPGPELRMKLGELIEVTLENEDIEDGVTLHWHGLDVPNAEDGVAGATQNAVMPGERHTYRFKAEQVGTFWYHSHQHSKEAVEKGLFGALIVEPADTEAEGDHSDDSGRFGDSIASAFADFTVMTHVWPGVGTAIGTYNGIVQEQVAPGTTVKLRLINTDNWTRRGYQLVGAPFKVAAIDGVDLNEPSELDGATLRLTTGGRYDIVFEMPEHPVYLSIDGSRTLGLLMSPEGSGEPPAVPKGGAEFDPTSYGEAALTPFDADSAFDREFNMVLDNKLAFYNGLPGLYDTINGNVFPFTPMFVVKEGELVKVTIANRSAVDHPMHLHGHHMLVLSRNGERVTGSPWWSDTLDVMPGEVYEVAFRADNPGLWMDHCHNLQHAAAGMTMHLMYDNVTSPYEIGTDTHNHPE